MGVHGEGPPTPMTDTDARTETIEVADVSDGPGGSADAEPGTTVELPVVELLTGRGFVTGKSGSGKSNTASVVVEKLLSANFPVLVVDTDGEYYGLKEEFELLHAGADEECDIQVSPEHAERLASLALEQNVPIILDVSGYLDEEVAQELLLRTARQLFAKEKKLKKPFLMLVEEVHEYVPEGGGLGETGKMLIKIGKRGRKHGLGIVGISQRPADVKKDFITQCDWLVWHRLTWGNDTKVVGRMLSKEHEAAVEDLDDGEGFLVTDWSESVRRVQFRRKQTFDAGATPGLDDFERPELKSVSGDLVSDLREISDEREQRESELARLRQELDKKERRISELERELEEARDLSNMADKFASAMLSRADATHRGGEGRNFARPEEKQAALREYERAAEAANGEAADVDDAGSVDDGDAADDDAAEDPSDPVGGYPGFDPGRDADVGGTDSDVPDSDAIASGAVTADGRRAIVHTLREFVADLDEVSRGMLAHYREAGAADPIDAHVAAGASGDRHLAYARNRPLRESGLVRRVDGDTYEYALPDLVREEYADRLDDGELDATVAAVERAFVDGEDERSDSPDARAGAKRRASGDADDTERDGADEDSVADRWPAVADPEE